MTTWPPKDRLVRVLTDIVDASPRGEWLTSAQRQLEAERIIEALYWKGLVIARPSEPSVEVEPAVSGSPHGAHAYNVESLGEPDLGSEYGSLLAERDRLIAAGADPADLAVPLPPPDELE